MRWYRIYAAAVVAFLGWAHWTGWSHTDVDEVKGVPKSVRNNPGSYRSPYRPTSRGWWRWGK